MADFVPGLPQRKPLPNLYTVLLATASILLIAGSVWLSLKNIDATSGDGRQAGGPFDYLAK